MVFVFERMTLALAQPEALPTSSLLFDPIRLILLIAWVYFCMYSVQKIEGSTYIPDRARFIMNLAALVLGPLILLLLSITDACRRLQQGEIEVGDLLTEIFGNPFKTTRRLPYGSSSRPASIELLDTAGRSFHEVYGSQQKGKDTVRDVLDLAESIILDGICQKASDILIDPKGGELYTVRFRVDGFLRVVQEIESQTCVAVVNSIKAISNMDIAEKRRPQDGSFLARIPQGDIHFRVASQGVLGGEKLSIRMLNQLSGVLTLQEIGLSHHEYATVDSAIKQSSGMIVVCGPTGSGKTTSLYAMLSMIDRFTRNVVTVEDPVEYVLPEVSQIEVNPKADITFATALRSILRQDPDVIVVGEIRDSETAQMAIQASQTGHLVLATLHASSNMAALVRLMDLQIKPLLIASGVSLILSQRLVRRICENCKEPATLTPQQIAHFMKKGIDPNLIMHGRGCGQCGNTGYTGRIGLFDVMQLDDEIKGRLTDGNLSLNDLKQQGDERGRSSLKKQGMRLVLEGVTTLDDVRRVISNLG